MRTLIGLHPKANECWLILLLQNHFNEKSYYRAIPKFKKEFERINMPTMNTFLNVMFNFEREEWAGYSFFQYKKDKVLNFNGGLGISKIHELTKNTFGNFISPSYAFPKFQAYLNKPIIQNNSVYPLNEEMAIYILMFFLSTLVRYHPDYLDDIFDSESTWLIEAFILNAPTIYLQAITNKILNKCSVYC